MNLQQFSYIVAVDTHRHFARAAETCFVSQPTLSTMIHKLEEELEVQIFDRSKQPVVPTPVGQRIITQAKKILKEVRELQEIVQEEKGLLEGELKVGIIPTLAPYLLPLFIQDFLTQHPNVKLTIREKVTDSIIEDLKTDHLDVGILVTPLDDSSLLDTPLFFEEFMVFSSHDYPKSYLMPEDIDPDELWLLEEGHCFRSQIMNLCELRREAHSQLEYHTGSIETLMQLVERQKGVTIIPELAYMNLSEQQKKKIKVFHPPAPTRRVSLVTHRHFLKRRLVEALEHNILAHLPDSIKDRNGDTLVRINED